MNIEKCSKCGYSVIAEESKSHVCKDVVDYKIEGKILWLFDGEIWYPRKLLHLDQPQGNRENNYRGGNSTCFSK